MFKKLRRHLFGPTWFERGYEAAQFDLKLYPLKVLHQVWLKAGNYQTNYSQGYYAAMVDHSITNVEASMGDLASEALVAQDAADDEP